MSESTIFPGSPTQSPEGGTDAVPPGVPTLQSLGAILRDRRESSGIPLAEVEHATRIRQKYLAAIEADEWHLLPGEVVGRGFLRNYAYYLNLDPNQMVDRRRSMVDSSLSRTLAGTSTGVRLPPTRPVDYRPQDVDLEQTAFSTRFTESVESMRDWMAPVLAAGLIVLVVLLAFWGIRQMSGQFGVIFSTVQERMSAATDGNRIQSGGQAGGSGGSTNANDGEPGVAPVATAVPPAPTATPTATTTPLPTATDAPQPAGTHAPPPEPTATETPTPTPTPTEEPTQEPPPQPEPQPGPPPVVPATCADGRLAISSPGVNQSVNGIVPITGRAVHEQFDFYKLEFAAGPDASDDFAWFDGSDRSGSGGVVGPPVENGTLGHFDSRGQPNGAYTLRLTVVDTSGNYPEPCQVNVNVRN